LQLGASGCSLGPYGTTAGRYTYTQDAIIVEVFSAGIVYQGESDGIAGIVGINKSLYIYPPASGAAQTSGWQFAALSRPKDPTVCKVSTTLGLELDASTNRYGVALGLINRFTSIGPAEGESRVVQLVYDSERKEQTYVNAAERP